MKGTNPTAVSEHLKLISFRPETCIFPLESVPTPQEDLQYLYTEKLPVKTNNLQGFFDAQVPDELVDSIEQNITGTFTPAQMIEVRRAIIFHHSRRIRFAVYAGATMCASDSEKFAGYFKRLTLHTAYEPYRLTNKNVVPRKEVKNAYKDPYKFQPMESVAVCTAAYYSYFHPGEETTTAECLNNTLKSNKDRKKIVDPILPFTRDFIELVLDKDTDSNDRHKVFAKALLRTLID